MWVDVGGGLYECMFSGLVFVGRRVRYLGRGDGMYGGDRRRGG
jgi:hypothetical protein